MAWGTRGTWAAQASGNERFRAVPRSRFSTDEAPTPIEIATTRTRFRELEEDIAKNGDAYTPYPWKVSVEGACAKPRVFDLDDLLTFAPFEERVYRMLCTEGWLHIVPYIGYPLLAAPGVADWKSPVRTLKEGQDRACLSAHQQYRRGSPALMLR